MFLSCVLNSMTYFFLSFIFMAHPSASVTRDTFRPAPPPVGGAGGGAAGCCLKEGTEVEWGMPVPAMVPVVGAAVRDDVGVGNCMECVCVCEVKVPARE